MPLFRTTEAYQRFHTIGQFANLLNQGVSRGLSFFKPKEFRQALFAALDRFRDDQSPTTA